VVTAPSRLAASCAPTLACERRLLRGSCRAVAGMDEVGRGAWAGPLVVGAVVVTPTTPRLPEGVRDSKQLSPTARQRLAPSIATWCAAWALGAATSDEVDELGVTRALALAGWRALWALEVRPDAVLVDGPVDFLTPNRQLGGSDDEMWAPGVTTIVRGDRSSGAIAAASILAKVRRDAQMEALASVCPGYGFERHKGYGTAEHAHAIASGGLTHHHRTSWSFAERLCPVAGAAG